jgi:hypothetical protein
VYYSRLAYLDTVVCTYRVFDMTEGYPCIYDWAEGIRRFTTEGSPCVRIGAEGIRRLLVNPLV